MRMRCPMMVQAAASYGDQNPTGRRPGYRRWTSPATGSRSPTAGKPEPSTSSDRIRSTCGRTSATRSAPGSAGLTIPASTFSPAWLTRIPTVRQVPSAGNASSSTPSGALEYHAGVNPSRNLMLAASENGPRGTRVNVSIPLITPRPTDISAGTRKGTGHLVARLVALGGTVLAEHPRFTTLADPEGNELC